MTSGEPPPPDLASVLQTLASYAPSTYDTNNAIPPSQSTTGRGGYAIQAPTSGVNHPAQSPKPPVVDSKTIITWPPALRYITNTIARNQDVMTRIKRIIKSQHDHEKEWWSNREALIQMQKKRVVDSKKVDEILYVHILVLGYSD